MKAKLELLLALHLAFIAIARGETAEEFDQILTRKMDEINEKENIPIYGDMLSLERTMEDNTDAGRGSVDPLVNRIEKFFRTRKLQIRLPSDGSSADFLGRALGWKRKDIELKGLVQGASEARTKLKKIFWPIVFTISMKEMIIYPVLMTLIGVIGLNGIAAGLLAIMISGAVGLTNLLTPPPPPRVTYGVARPHDIIHHDHWHRSQEEVNEPYRGWVPEFTGEQYPYQEIP